MNPSVDFEKILKRAEETGVDQATIRYNKRRYEYILVTNGVVDELTYNDNEGVGISVLINGAPGYAYTTKLDEKSLIETLEKAVKAAKASIGKSYKIELAEVKPVVDKVVSPYKECPFEVDEKEKI
ncbi:MAG TPA: TldD/PmbA family protein, partial [Euryarchaeota archaeon]|nr:TldD/PmbA family protein [Euryarchaeota archaeon]